MWQSFGYFDNKGNQEFIKAISQSLKKGGYFLLDTQVAETLFPIYKPKQNFRIAGVNVIINRFLDNKTSRNEEQFTFIKKGKRTSYHSSIRTYTYQEVVKLLRQNGFLPIKAFGSFSKKPFKFGVSRLLIAARKI